MERFSARGPLTVLRYLTPEPRSTSELYEEVGYVNLMKAGLIPYRAFHRALEELEAEGLARSEVDEEEGTLWRRA